MNDSAFDNVLPLHLIIFDVLKNGSKLAAITINRNLFNSQLLCMMPFMLKWLLKQLNL